MACFSQVVQGPTSGDGSLRTCCSSSDRLAATHLQTHLFSHPFGATQLRAPICFFSALNGNLTLTPARRGGLGPAWVAPERHSGEFCLWGVALGPGESAQALICQVNGADPAPGD